MKQRARLWQVLFAAILIASLVFPSGISSAAPATAAPSQVLPAARMAAAAAPNVDGVIDAAYGSPVASDKPGDGNGAAILDLLDLYVTQDAASYYFAFTINGDIGATGWGKYGLYIDTTNDANGATSDPWGRKVTASDPHKPEFAIYTYVDSPPYGTGAVQLFAWNGTSWDGGMTVDAAALSAGTTSAVEWQVAKSKLGGAATLWVEVLSTGGGSDPAMDTINKPAEDWNAANWGDPSTILVSTQVGAPLVDGVVDPLYGAPIAQDKPGDGNGNSNMDLLDLYVTEDLDNFYFAYTITGDIGLANWGKYAIYIDTTNDANGATSDAWGRNIVVNNPHKPEFGIYSWTDQPPYGPDRVQLWAWNGSGWSMMSGVTGAALTGGSPSVIEWKVSRAALQNPENLWVEVFNTGGGGIDNAQDTINLPAEDWNATDWSTQAVLSVSTPYAARFYTPPAPHAAHDNNIWWNDLGFNSRDDLFRSPVGPVTTGSTVAFRFRAAAGDLTAAQVRLYNDRTNAEQILPMTLVHDDGTYEWWQLVFDAGADPTVFWYRFIAIDGTATAYYEDDAARTMGWGKTFGSSPDNSYQLTVFDPAFTTPDWMKTGIVYQVFPDRFRDGSAANNTPAGSFFYNEPGGTVSRSLTTDWNTAVCDPRAAGACAGTYSKNFYGGDLQGLISKLDYLQDLGITVIYLNPIFESPSNHKYDATNYLQIDDNFGTLADFQTLTAEAASRGMSIILDGVFNHTSSDSIYFDRYGRYTQVGACESLNSNYRSWYYFSAADPLGSGPCAGENYTSWFGYDSLPKLNSSNQQVRDLIWAQGLSSVANYWLSQGADGWRLDVAGDIDPGLTNDPANDYWEGFRAAVRATDPQAYIAGEEWGNPSAWVLGNEWDASMNYQFAAAALSFWRDTTFVDNDNNSGSSMGELKPLTPSQLDERLMSWAERIPAPSLQVMMNLLDSHDTSRALFKLDENTSKNDPSLYADPNYDWSDAVQRLKGVVMIQMTLPGAPTIYYGDEVGLVGPEAYAGGKWEDDPYNRQPFPWLDETGTPFYKHLQTQAGQDILRDYYKALIAARKAHPSLTTGSLKTLLVDDTANTYAYLRQAEGDAALVLINRANTPQNVIVSVKGDLPVALAFTDVLNPSQKYYVAMDGTVGVVNVPAKTAMLLVAADAYITRPAAPMNLVAAEGPGKVDLTWDAVSGAASYNVYRSLFAGSAYELIGSPAAANYSDTGLSNGKTYYYVVTSVTALGVESLYSNEVAAIPHFTIGWGNIQWPKTITQTLTTNPTTIYGQVWADTFTGKGGKPADGLVAQVGFGPAGAAPVTFIGWVNATFNTAAGNNDEFKADILPEQVGSYDYYYRYSTTAGRDWVYADQDGLVADPSAASAKAGKMTITAPTDTELPSAPTNLRWTDFSAGSISLAWDASTDNVAVYGYEVYRSETAADPNPMKIARVTGTAFTDNGVTTGVTYYYTVKAIDTSFNYSAASNEISKKAEAKMVTVTLNVTVPAGTPGDVFFTRKYDPAAKTLGDWDPAAFKLARVGATDVFTGQMVLPDGYKAEFKFARGTWDKVEKDAAGQEISNRAFTAAYGTTGTQVLDLTVESWRDPFVVAYTPAGPVAPLGAVISLTWSKPMNASAQFVVTDQNGRAVPGTFAYDDPTRTITFTPDSPLVKGWWYQVNAAGLSAATGDVQQVKTEFRFTYQEYSIWLVNLKNNMP